MQNADCLRHQNLILIYTCITVEHSPQQSDFVQVVGNLSCSNKHVHRLLFTSFLLLRYFVSLKCICMAFGMHTPLDQYKVSTVVQY